jgi:hypothetical protein
MQALEERPIYEASAFATTGLRKWGANHELIWRDRNVVVILDWDAESTGDFSIDDMLSLANVQSNVIGANLASYQ